MVELFDWKASEVIDYLVENQIETRGISKALAKKLVLNALTYNVVVEAVAEQISFLAGDYEQ